MVPSPRRMAHIYHNTAKGPEMIPPKTDTCDTFLRDSIRFSSAKLLTRFILLKYSF